MWYSSIYFKIYGNWDSKKNSETNVISNRVKLQIQVSSISNAMSLVGQHSNTQMLAHKLPLGDGFSSL